ncbi:hypothetical protein [uncultured Pantoea sp.]|uniref:hypothetical protein n=1 Tax=uncultured Pantoea sp. TaxID=218084 RepID=UPI0025F78D16|nr:hypothetical protein [uncultured Pantoea sp.]
MKISKFVVATLIFITFTLGGCTSYHAVNLRQQQLKNHYTYYKIAPPVYAGDIIKLTHKDGSKDRITVQSITLHAIISTTGQIIEFDDITSIERKDFSKVKTVALVGASTLLVVVSLAYAAALTVIVAKSISTIFFAA